MYGAMMQSKASFGVLIKRAFQHKGYLTALTSSYLLMLTSILIQIGLVPLYLSSLGQYQFGVLMILLSLVNFAVIGIAWMSGGALRMLGEFTGLENFNEFYRAFNLIKTVYVGYGCIIALIIVVIAFSFDQILFSGSSVEDSHSARTTLILTGIYLIFFFAVAIDRIALTVRKKQGAANMAQLAGIVVFAVGVTPWLLRGGSMPGVMLFQIGGVLVSLIITRCLLNREIPALRMCIPSSSDVNLLRQLGGKTGAGFFLHGVFVLALLADTALVGWLGGANSAAEFYLVWKIAEVLVQLIWKLSEPMVPYFIQMDVRGEHASLARVAHLGYMFVAGVSLLAGVMYGFFGPDLVALWVGRPNVPNNPLGYALAGGAVFWLSISRFPAIVASAQVALRELNWAGGLELLGKLLVSFCLFPRLGYVAVLLGINLVHALGVSFLYYRLLQTNLKVAEKENA